MRATPTTAPATVSTTASQLDATPVARLGGVAVQQMSVQVFVQHPRAAMAGLGAITLMSSRCALSFEASNSQAFAWMQMEYARTLPQLATAPSTRW